VSIALKSDLAWDEKGKVWVDVRKWYQRARKKISIWQRPFCSNCSQLKFTTAPFLPSQQPNQLPSPFLKMSTTGADWRAQNISAANFRRSTSDFVYLKSKISYAAPTPSGSLMLVYMLNLISY
jgi:hypothetical protein